MKTHQGPGLLLVNGNPDSPSHVNTLRGTCLSVWSTPGLWGNRSPPGVLQHYGRMDLTI